MAGAGILPRVLGIQGLAAFGAEFTALLVGAVLTLLWFHRSFTVAVSEAQRFANDLAGCNLTTAVADFAPPMGALIRSLRQIQINLQAVVGDVRGESTRENCPIRSRDRCRRHGSLSAYRITGQQPGANRGVHGANLQHGPANRQHSR